MGLPSVACGAMGERDAILDSRPTESTKTVAPIATRRLVVRTLRTRLAAPPGTTAYAATSAVRPIAALAKVQLPLRRNLSTTSAASPIPQPERAIHEGRPVSIVANTRPVACIADASRTSISADLDTIADRVRHATPRRTNATA